jgi:di/tricarboxylate transporter
MNNIGALAIFMPVALQMARKSERSPYYLLMPLAFGSLLGGMVTLIGTPPNIIIANYREQATGEAFRMFSFAPVGIGVALAGGAFISLVGWRFIPRRKGQASREELFEIENYLTEVRVVEDSGIAGKPLTKIPVFSEHNVLVLAIVRGENRLSTPSRLEVIRPGDVLIVEADSESLKALVDTNDFELVADQEVGLEMMENEEARVIEAVITPNSIMQGRTARGLNLRWRSEIVLLAVARQGRRLRARLGDIRLKAGDILLLRGREEALMGASAELGYLPLAERRLRLGEPRRIALSLGLFGGAILSAAFGWVPVQIAFSVAAVAMVLAGLLSLREVYESIEWPIIILLGAMIPVGQALETTGGAQRIAEWIIALRDVLPPAAVLAVVLIVTMFLSDLVNNAAAAVLMAPIALGVAAGLDASPDPFLMSVAIGASCAFLTPIGHQANALVMGPGGYRFGDYWRLGLPLEIIVVVVAVPLLLWFWPMF